MLQTNVSVNGTTIAGKIVTSPKYQEILANFSDSYPVVMDYMYNLTSIESFDSLMLDIQQTLPDMISGIKSSHFNTSVVETLSRDFLDDLIALPDYGNIDDPYLNLD